MRSTPARKLAFLGGGLLAVLLVVGAPTLGQGFAEPSGEVTTAECYGHHKEQGFRSMDLFPEQIEEAPKGQPFEFKMTIRNPWLHELRDVYGYVNISNAPGLSFPGEKEPMVAEPVAGTFDPSPTERARTTLTIPVEANATELVITLVGVPSDPVSPPVGPSIPTGRVQRDYDLTLAAPGGGQSFPENAVEEPDPNDPRAVPTTTEEIRLGYDNLTAGGTGDWTATIWFRGAEAGEYTVHYAVYYNLSKASELRLPAPQRTLASGETTTVSFTINAKDAEDLQLLRYGGIALAYHDHTDRNTEDEGVYNKWGSFNIVLGTELRTSAAVVDDTGIDTLSPIFRRWGEVLGFAGSFLLIPSLVLGGTFGKGSVNLFNKVFGSPRRRVLFHNSVSFWLLGVSILHLVLLLYETQWGWSHGLVWGGLALACMIGLGVTGATQRAFVARWGFTRWRFVHFAMGVLVAVFVLVHVVADGEHLAPVREALFGAVKA